MDYVFLLSSYIYIYIYIYYQQAVELYTSLQGGWTREIFLVVIEHSFFQAAAVSILLYGCTTWRLTKRLEKEITQECCKLYRHQLYGHLPPITKTIQVRRTRHVGHGWRSKDELISDVLLWTPGIWPSKSRTTTSNIHIASMSGYGI